MPKKPPKNGFFYFMLNFKQRAESNGKTFPGGLPEVATAASPEWKTLPQFRKDYYNDLAKDRRNDPRPNVPKRDERRFNSQGKSFAELKMEKANAEERRNQEHDLRDKLIYLIHVNIFCKTDKDVYYPAEIGIVKFSLRGGVKDVLHRYIDPGDIAPGYSFEVKDHSERTHKLTPQFVRSVDGTSDFPRLYCEIRKFLTEDEVKSEDTMPPLFTMYDNVFLNSSLNAVKGTFRSLWSHIHPSDDPDDNNWENVFKILPLPDMFYHLKNRCMAVTNPQTIAFPNDVLARAQLQKDTYHYELDTACKFHRDEDIIAHCSQSFVLRWVYIIRDHCADLIGVDMFPKYIAPKTEIKEETDKYYDTASMTDSQYSNSWSETSRATSDWGMKHEIESYGCERKIKRERDDYSPDKVKRDIDRYSPERRVKRERDHYSSDRHVKRERDRYSPDRRMKRERDRSCSPDRRMKREKDRSNSPDRSSRPERDPHPSVERVPKCEKDCYLSPERVIKREKDADGHSKASPVKHERSADGFPGSSTSIRNVEANLVKPENGSDNVLYDGTFKREKVDERVTVGSIKKEKNVEPYTSDSIKLEKEACWYSKPVTIKPETDVTSSIKQDADFIKQEKDTASVKPEKYCDLIHVEKPGSAVKEENVIKKEKEVDVDATTGRVKVETVDLTYSDW